MANVILNLPLFVDVLLIVLVELSKLNPFGKLPEEIDQEYGAFPLVD
ncbi:MAG TPA: hypothetical protein VJ464_25855 [Blastocatellia bacterium]|nr:hypothetical protein [Blastocatellia bacterium]